MKVGMNNNNYEILKDNIISHFFLSSSLSVSLSVSHILFHYLPRTCSLSPSSLYPTSNNLGWKYTWTGSFACDYHPNGKWTREYWLSRRFSTSFSVQEMLVFPLLYHSTFPLRDERCRWDTALAFPIRYPDANSFQNAPSIAIPG